MEDKKCKKSKKRNQEEEDGFPAVCCFTCSAKLAPTLSPRPGRQCTFVQRQNQADGGIIPLYSVVVVIKST